MLPPHIAALLAYYNRRATDPRAYFHLLHFPYIGDSLFNQIYTTLPKTALHFASQHLQQVYAAADNSWGDDWRMSLTEVMERDVNSTEWQQLRNLKYLAGQDLLTATFLKATLTIGGSQDSHESPFACYSLQTSQTDFCINADTLSPECLIFPYYYRNN